MSDENQETAQKYHWHRFHHATGISVPLHGVITRFIIIIYLICQSRLGGTKRHSLYKGASQKHKTQYKHIVHRDRYNNKTQIQLEENTKTKYYNNHTVKLKFKYNKKTDIGHDETLVDQESI